MNESIFYSKTVPMLEKHPNIPNAYIALVCNSALLGIAGYIRDVTWIGLAVTNPEDGSISFPSSSVWIKDDATREQHEKYVKGFTDFIAKKKNIVDIPFFKDNDNGEVDAYNHYHSLDCMKSI